MTTIVQPFTGSYTADPDHSSLQAELRHMGVGTFRTGFEDFRARLEVSSDGLTLTGRARVDSITIKRPAEFRAHVVEGAEFFDAANHPEIGFTSDRIDLAEDGTLAVDGTLSIRGHSHPVSATGTYVAPLEDLYGGQRAAIHLTAEINRRDWGMTFQAQLPRGGDVLSWTVKLSIHLELVADAA
jgi:polyisoprenoid-binding protein YceI